MNPVTEDIKDLLVSGSIGAFAGTGDWGIYIGKEPDAPNKCITIYDTGGPVPLECMSRTKKPLLRPSFQIRVRGTGYTSTYTKIRAVIDLLRRYGPWTIAAQTETTRHLDNVRPYDSLVAAVEMSDIWCSFYPTHTGNLAKFIMYMDKVGGTSGASIFLFRFYSGANPTTGTLLYTQNNVALIPLPTPHVGDTTYVGGSFELTTPQAVVSGSQYCWRMGYFATSVSSATDQFYLGETNMPNGRSPAFSDYVDVTTVTVPAVNYLDVFQQGEELYLMQDEKKRYIWVCNFYAFRKENNS